MRPIEEQTILITGATGGLGRELGRALAKRRATLLLHGRDAKLGLELVREIMEATGHRQIVSSGARLDVLVNNAAVGFGPKGAKREISQDGYELRFAVNYLAPYLLTDRLISLLEASSPARIVNVASIGQPPMNFDDLMLTNDYSGVQAYRQSKLAMITWTFDLAKRLAGKGITVNALHPASLMPTKMVLEAGWQTMSSVEDGLKATLRLVIDPALEAVTGEFFDRLTIAKANPQAYDKDARRRLAKLSQEMILRP